MALKGSLADLGIIDLLQLPHTGRKTGTLVIGGAEGARLVYDKGKLYHAALGDKVGMDVLVEVVGWIEGDFELVSSEEPETTEQTIDVDLHRAIMQALKLKDEIALAEQRRAEEQVARAGLCDDAGAAKLEQVVAEIGVVQYAALMDEDGSIAAHAPADLGGQEHMAALRRKLLPVALAAPRPGFCRVILEDAQGAAVLCRSGERLLLTVMRGGTPLGAVHVAAEKARAALAGEL